MAKSPHPDSTGDNPDAGVGAGRASPPGMPRWVKIFGLIAIIVLVVLFVIQHLSGLGGMGGHR